MRKQIDNVNDVGNRGADDILEAVQAVSHLVRARQLQVLRGAQEDLTPLEARVLFYFAHHPNGTLGELTEHAGRDKGQLGRLVSGLRERGWLLGETDPADRRVIRFTLTDQALLRQNSMTNQRSELTASASRGLAAGERQQLLALLGRIRENLERLPPAA